MKSIIATQYGGPEVMELRDVPIPEPDDSQIRVKVVNAGVNYADIMQRLGSYIGGPHPPFGMGFEFSGVVDKTGAKVTQWKPGDAVMGFCSAGYSEYIVAEASKVMPKPEGIDFQQAAAIPCQYLTAYFSLVTLSQLHAGQTVLIQAAAGGLGTLLVQVAKNIGATVIGTCGTEEKRRYLLTLGCDFAINYIENDFRKEVMDITHGEGCDLIIESVGGKIFDDSLRCLKQRGRIVTLGFASGKPKTIQVLYLLSHNMTISGFHLFGYSDDLAAMASAMRDFQQWMREGRLKIIVKHAFPLERAAEAHQFISDRKSIGKVVLDIQ